MKCYIIYKATCKITNKVYIGYTNSNKGLERRKYEHYRNAFNGGSTKFYNALNKYPESFEWECLFEVNSHKEAKELEIKMIQEYNSYKSGYNSTIGGDGGDLSKHREYKRTFVEDDIQKDIIEMYTNGIGKAEIRRKYPELTINMITKILERNEIPVLPPINQRNKKQPKKLNTSYVGNKNSQYIVFDKDQIESMISEYKNKKLTKKQICEKYKITYKVLRRIFLENNVTKNEPQYC
jgi:hypothetical protein